MTEFNTEYIELVEKLAKLGATDREMCEIVGCAESTFNKWKNEYPEFKDALLRGKQRADAEVAHKLYMTAVGYHYEDVHVTNYQGDIKVTKLKKYMHPNPVSCFFWLKNRQKELWRDKHEYEVKGTGPITPDDVTNEELARWFSYNYRKTDAQIIDKKVAAESVKEMKKLHKKSGQKTETVQ